LRVKPLGGYEAADVPAWLPIGITGVVRQAERNSTVVAVAPVEVLMIPGELFHREWFRPYEEHEIAELIAGIQRG
jgi:CRP-like cAMP-binding protein